MSSVRRDFEISKEREESWQDWKRVYLFVLLNNLDGIVSQQGRVLIV